jgi:hypothetical protein
MIDPSFPLTDMYAITKPHHMLFLLSKNIVGPLRLFKLSDMVI